MFSFTYILMVHFFFIFCFSSSYHNFGCGYVLTRGNQNLGWNKTFYAFYTSKWQLLFLHQFLTSLFLHFPSLAFWRKSVIVVSNSCEKLYQVLSYPLWQSLHFFYILLYHSHMLHHKCLRSCRHWDREIKWGF